MKLIGQKYQLNPETLRYERITLTSKQRVRYSLIFGIGIVMLAVLLRYGFERYYPTPRQLIYEKQNSALRSDYAALDNQLQLVESSLMELTDRDDRFYRSILSLEPVPASIRGAGTGGSERNSHLRNLRDPGVVVNVSQKIELMASRLQIQSSSLERVYSEAVTNQQFLASKPSIHPISPADPFWLTSTYGYRIDPFTHKNTAHYGLDLAGPYGLDIHCTGEGTVITAHVSKYGYGNEVLVDHGFGYVSRYAHLQEILVEPGQKVKRGEVIGTLGSSGRSTGPHLHYEVHLDNRTVNPMYYFYENLSPEEYTELAARANPVENGYQPVAMAQK